MWRGQNRRKPENQPGRRDSDNLYCPLHGTHSTQLAVIENDLKGKVSMKLFGIFIGSATALVIFVGGIMISNQKEMQKNISDIKLKQATINAKMDYQITKKVDPLEKIGDKKDRRKRLGDENR